MIVHAFITRDHWMLQRHLEVFWQFCDRIVAVVDRSPYGEHLCEESGAEVIRWNGADRADFNEHGVVMDEGLMRQAAWDAAMKYSPSLVVFGDTDELPTPAIAEWLQFGPDLTVEHWYADWVNLWGDEAHAIGGQSSEWSFQKASNNKKGIATRPIPGKQYRYRPDIQHVRMEPSPLHEGKADRWRRRRQLQHESRPLLARGARA